MNIRYEGSLFLKMQNFSDEHLHGHKSMNKYKSPVSDENTTKVTGSNKEVFGVWSGCEREMSSTWREAEGGKTGHA